MFVTTESLTKRYRQVTALEDCSFSVARGEVVGLLGPNGAGKTTLIRLLLGYLGPTSGRAMIGGFDCCHQSLQVRQLTSYLPAEAKLFRSMRGSDVVDFFAATRSHSPIQRYRALADRLELDLSRRVASMSTGMRQKLALAVTLATGTPLMILDEPTANLDPTVRAEVIAAVREAREAGQTILFSSHVLSEVEEACERVAILRAGRLVHVQPMSDLRRRHRIYVWLQRPLPDGWGRFHEKAAVIEADNQRITLESDGELAPMLAWLANLPLADVRVEQVGLRSIYEQFHGSPSRKMLA